MGLVAERLGPVQPSGSGARRIVGRALFVPSARDGHPVDPGLPEGTFQFAAGPDGSARVDAPGRLLESGVRTGRTDKGPDQDFTERHVRAIHLTGLPWRSCTDEAARTFSRSTGVRRNTLRTQAVWWPTRAAWPGSSSRGERSHCRAWGLECGGSTRGSSQMNSPKTRKRGSVRDAQPEYPTRTSVPGPGFPGRRPPTSEVTSGQTPSRYSLLVRAVSLRSRRIEAPGGRQSPVPSL